MKSYQVIFSDHNSMKLENTQNEKIHKYMGLNKMLNNNQQVTEEIRGKKFLESNKNGNITY